MLRHFSKMWISRKSAFFELGHRVCDQMLAKEWFRVAGAIPEIFWDFGNFDVSMQNFIDNGTPKSNFATP